MSGQPPPGSIIGGATAAAIAENDAEFPTWVRNWVHYEHLASGFYKQAINARKVRDEYEERIVSSLERRKMMNAVLQLKQGKYKVMKETTSSPLSLTNIEGLLHLYFKTKGAAGRDETSEIMSFIKQHRQQNHNYRLRRLNDPAATLPAPAGDMM
jgi:hypothetical protein